nr:hypothetical protein [Nitrosomonas nitrosa]
MRWLRWRQPTLESIAQDRLKCVYRVEQRAFEVLALCDRSRHVGKRHREPAVILGAEGCHENCARHLKLRQGGSWAKQASGQPSSSALARIAWWFVTPV